MLTSGCSVHETPNGLTYVLHSDRSKAALLGRGCDGRVSPTLPTGSEPRSAELELLDGVASLDLNSARCDWMCDSFARLERASRAGAGAEECSTPPCATGALLSGAGWSFETDDSDAEVSACEWLLRELADPRDLRARAVGFTRDVQLLKLSAAAGGGGGGGDSAAAARYFRVRVRKTGPARALLALLDVTSVVARGAVGAAGAARDAKARAKLAAQEREAHVRSFVFHEIGNLSTGLYGVLDELRDTARKRRAPTRT